MPARQTVRPILWLSIMAMTLSASFFSFWSPPNAHADAPNDYPSFLATPAKDSVNDPWGFENRECTSFVAWRLNNNNQLAFQNTNYQGTATRFGDAQNWGSVAQSLGIPVNNTPAVGAVAWWYFSASAGHVAWVTAINPNGSVQVEDYNWNYDGNFLDHTLTSAPTGYIHFQDLSGTASILALKSDLSPDGAIETFATTASRVTEGWYFDGGNGVHTSNIIDIAQHDIIGIDKLNIGTTEALYTAVSDGVWETTWVPGGSVQSSKIVTGLSGVRAVFAENTFDTNGYYIHHLYILAADGPYEAYWQDSDPTHTVHVGRLVQINGGIAMTHSVGPDGSEQLYVAVPAWVYEISWFPNGTITTRTIINITQGNIRSVEKGANLPDGGQLLYTTTSTTVWQTYWNGSSGFSNGTIATGQVNGFQSLKVVTSDGVHHLYLATPDHVQEYWWLGANAGGGELIRISQNNLAAIAQQLDGTTQLLMTAAATNVWETWWNSSQAPTTTFLFTVAA